MSVALARSVGRRDTVGRVKESRGAFVGNGVDEGVPGVFLLSRRRARRVAMDSGACR